MRIDKAEQNITYLKDLDPETGQYYGEVILRGRLGFITGMMEKLLRNHVGPDAEALDKKGLETFRTIDEMVGEIAE